MLSEVRAGRISSELDTLLHQLKTYIINLSPSKDGLIKVSLNKLMITRTIIISLYYYSYVMDFH